MTRRAFLRSVNEQIAELSVRHKPPARVAVSFVCECGDYGCSERLELTRTEYERVRSYRAGFLLKSGHADPEVERVVEARNEHVVVERFDLPLERLLESIGSGDAPQRETSVD